MKTEELENELEYLKARKEFEEWKHKIKMEKLKYIREPDAIRHEKELERGRIKTAEVRKTMAMGNIIMLRGKEIVEYYENEEGIVYRYSKGRWEELMGESWESCYSDEEELNEARRKLE